MELLADRDPEEARMILDPVLEQMVEAVIDSRLRESGHGATASWRFSALHWPTRITPFERACRAPDAGQREALRRGGPSGPRGRGEDQSGTEFRGGRRSRRSGSDLHVDYTAVGQTTHLAGRRSSLPSRGAIVIGARYPRAS